MFVALFGAAGCGSGGRGASSSTKVPVTGSVPAVARPALGLTEDNADLLWPPGEGEGGNGSARAFQAARTELTALHPSYLRLLVDWAALQPSREQPPDLRARIDGCARGVRPCGAYGGIRAEFAAIAAQQRSATSGSGAFRIVLDVFGTPDWAARSPSGCELAGSTPFARPLDADAIGDYRALVRSLLEMARAEGVALEWWSPWNEPNDPRFISPQRSSCRPRSPALSPAVYAQLVRAMAAELQEAGGAHHLVLGELNDLEVGSPHTTSVAEFIAALPTDVLCLGTVYSIHAYARYGEDDGEQASIARPVEALEAALDARGGCAREAKIWVTEAGAGGPHPGQPRAAEAAGVLEEEAGCRALSDQLQGWDEDPRVTAVFQYSFRDDPDFPVGLVSADLAHLHRTYALWLDWSRSRRTGQGMPSPTLCA